MKRINMVGKRYGRLTVQMEQGKQVLCKCDCGEPLLAIRGNVLAGYTKSCGCYRNDRLRAEVSTHGMARTVLYEKWKAIRRRCNNPNSTQYQWYGGKGIKMCDSWNDFANFYADMAPSYQEGLTIDRINNDKDYCPENCRWVTKSENSRNKRGPAL